MPTPQKEEKLDQMTTQTIVQQQGTEIQSEADGQERTEVNSQVLSIQRQTTEPSSSGMSKASRREFKPP